jgi:hypothetical protein
MSSDNVSGADNQQARTKKNISDQYLTGFVEGEGCFYVGFGKRIDLPLKWQIITEFHVSQNPGGRNILEALKDRLGCGYVKPNHPGSCRDRTWVLVVKNRKDLRAKVIPFFERNKLHSQKWQEFLMFKEAISLIEKGRHLKPEGFRQVVNLVYGLPNKSGRKKYSKKQILSSLAPETVRRSPK